MNEIQISQQAAGKILAEAHENRMPGAARIEINDLEKILNSLTVKDKPRQIRIDIGAEFLSWAINNQEKSKYVGRVMISPWWDWLDECYPPPQKD